jgi:hypothetical protein
MPFLHPAIAWSALGLAAIPVIIHLINRRRLRRLEWAAMEFLLAALKRTRRRIHLEQLILLLVRVALMALLALFLSRPLLSDARFGWLASALRKEEKVFVIDDSMSMSRRQADGTALKRGVEAVAQEINRLGRQRAGDIVSLVRTSRFDALPAGTLLDPQSAAELEQTVRAFQPTSARMDLAATLERLAERAASASAAGPEHPRSISIVTDLRAIDWTDGAGGPSAALAQALKRLTESEENPARVVIFDVGTDDSANVAIADVSLEGGRPTVGIPTEVRARLRNFGREPVRDLRLAMSFGPVDAEAESGTGTTGTVLAPGVEEIAGGESAVASIPCTFRRAGQYWARVEVSGGSDPLPEDNRLAIVLDVVDSTEVLAVSGEPASEPEEEETHFLVTALDPEGNASEGVSPVVVVEDRAPEEPLEKYAIVFLSNVHSMPEAFRRRLGRYVREGGSLVVFPGDQVDPAEYERGLGLADGPADEEHPWRDLSPARLLEIAGASTETPGAAGSGAASAMSAGLRPSYDHPYFRELRDAQPYLEQVMFRRYWKLEPRETAQVLARFSDPQESPALIERSAGAGRVLLFAVPADDEWHDWPRNGTYAILLRRIFEEIGRPRSGPAARLAGQPVEIRLDVSRYKLEARFRAPDYPRTPEGTLRASPCAGPAPEGSGATSGAAEEFRFLLDPKTTLEAGLFRLALAARDGGELWQAVAIRSDPAESDLTRITPLELQQLYPDVELRVIRDAASFSEAGRGEFEIADLLLALFAGLLLVEGVLACWFAHHRRAAGGELASAKSIPVLAEAAR